jgi:hypothetical protein
MENKKAWMIGLFVLLLVSSVSAYQVNQPLNVQAKLQYDNGLTLVDVNSQACIMSVFDHANNSLVVRDKNMTPAGGYHSYSFIPSDVGTYTINVKCVFNSEEAVYYEDVEIVQLTNEPSGGGVGSQVLNLNAKISPDKLNYVVNLKGDTRLKFPVNYYAGGVLKNSNEAEWRIIKEDKVLNKGSFIILSTGTYQFDYDFKDYLTGDYKIFLYFDGRNEIVNLKVISISEDLNAITGWAVNSDGNVSPVRAIIGISFLILIIVAVVLFFKRMGRGGRKK